jgi:hypothetical protein
MSPHNVNPESPLGLLVREHRLRWTYALAVALFGGIFTLGGTLGLGRVVFKLISEGADDETLVVLFAALVFLGAGAIVLLWGAVRFQRIVRLYQGGFSYKDRKGERAIPWNDIDGVYQKIVRVYQAGVEVDVQDSYTIALRDGARIEVDFHFADIDAFGMAVTNAVTAIHLPGARQAFHAGYPLDFGPVRLDYNGVHAEGKFLPWNDVQGISWKQGILSSNRAFLQIRRVGGLLAWAKLPIEDIKNYSVLIAIAADLRKAE